jgi:hypothetical protein
MRARPVLLGVVVVAALAGLALVLVRGSSATIVSHVTESGPVVECSGWTGVSDGCREWGARIVEAGPPTTTFEFEDVVRIRLDRPALGFAERCVAEYFLGRYPVDVAWTDEVDCPEG